MWTRRSVNVFLVVVALMAASALSACAPVTAPSGGAVAEQATPEASQSSGTSSSPGPMAGMMERWGAMQAQQQSGNPMPMSDMMSEMDAMLGEMQGMMGAPGQVGGSEMGQPMMAMLGEMMTTAQAMMQEMPSMPVEQQQPHMSQMMTLMSKMVEVMGQMHGMADGVAASTPMTGTMPMGQGDMGQMMGHMNEMMGMMGGEGAMDPDAMAEMMSNMMAMMGEMQGMMGGMNATAPMTGTMPMGQDDMGQMMTMMGTMMQMMMQMHQGMMGGGMGPMASTETITPTTSVAQPVASDVLTQTFQAGDVTVNVRPSNLGEEDADTLDFQITLETHAGSLDFNLAELAVLQIGDTEIAASSWEPSGEGHHISGVLSFPIVDASGTSTLTGAEEVSLVVRNLAGLDLQVLTWSIADVGMDHGAMADASLPFDAQFIDSMIEHHQGAIAMAIEAQAQAEHEEIKQLADAIIAAQTEEITQMTAWRAAWYLDLPPTAGMGMSMGEMAIGGDESVPFDKRFIEAMISHHQGAIDMATEAQTRAEHEEIRQLADAIITAQQAEIEQMQTWLEEWYE